MRGLIALLFFICFTAVSQAQNTVPHRFFSKEKVGAILFDPAQDDPDFHFCDALNVMEYYQVDSKYGEGLKSVREYFTDKTAAIEKWIDFEAGLLTVRFIINCEGATNRYRVKAVDREYQAMTIPKELEAILIREVRGMGDWVPGFYHDTYYDSYFTLSFKIRHGKIQEILP